ncbi:MAG: hypothetical protein NC187_07675 [Candidatus Amulumruptor caecigallinarius]|nr:hypothetical protein [Candidatus Amulumruptor caecigallinarius]MCM1397348.1 hypothetical protein [Candidatus Amulumruptor caecigallinarius]MCM1453589.1 hypothetical protein [bacterium]
MGTFIKYAAVIIACICLCPMAHAATENMKAFPGCPEIEALISMHKSLYQDAVTSSKFVAATVPQNIEKKSLQQKWKETREVVNQRLDAASAWASLATLLITTSLDVIDLSTELNDFIAEGQTLIRQNPATAFYYYKTYTYVSDEIKRLSKQVAISSLAQSGVLKSTMEQKFAVMYSIGSSITIIRGALRSTLFKCRWMLGDKIRLEHIREIVKDDEMQRYAKSAIDWWMSRHHNEETEKTN